VPTLLESTINQLKNCLKFKHVDKLHFLYLCYQQITPFSNYCAKNVYLEHVFRRAPQILLTRRAKHIFHWARQWRAPPNSIYRPLRSIGVSTFSGIRFSIESDRKQSKRSTDNSIARTEKTHYSRSLISWILNQKCCADRTVTKSALNCAGNRREPVCPVLFHGDFQFFEESFYMLS
jgi:hypothetical protein